MDLLLITFLTRPSLVEPRSSTRQKGRKEGRKEEGRKDKTLNSLQNHKGSTRVVLG